MKSKIGYQQKKQICPFYKATRQILRPTEISRRWHRDIGSQALKLTTDVEIVLKEKIVCSYTSLSPLTPS